jgi:mono/diheme cytochrome c family protein
MKTIKISIALFATLLFASCGGNETATNETVTSHEEVAVVVEEKVEEVVAEETAVVNTSEMSKGVGPITSIELGEIDEALVEKGKEVYKANCTACHKMKKRFVGPSLDGVTSRRSPEWIMNMILNPEEMVKEDETAKALLMEYSAPMANQSLTEEEARAILEFFRTRN